MTIVYWCLTPYSNIYFTYKTSKRWDRAWLKRPCLKPRAIGRSMPDRKRYGRRMNQHEMDSQWPHWCKTPVLVILPCWSPKPLRHGVPLTYWGHRLNNPWISWGTSWMEPLTLLFKQKKRMQVYVFFSFLLKKKVTCTDIPYGWA